MINKVSKNLEKLDSNLVEKKPEIVKHFEAGG